MANEELLDKIRQNYESARQIAKDVWITMDNEGDANDYYYFECGFISGLNYNFDGSLREETNEKNNKN